MEPQEQPEATDVPKRLNFTSVPALATGIGLSALLLVAAMVGWYAIGPDVRAQVSWGQGAIWLTLIFIMLAIMLSVGYSRLWADENGVSIRNGPMFKRLPVSAVAGLRLRKGDPWMYVLVKGTEGLEKVPVLAVQSLEGNTARRKVNQLRAWLKANGATSKDVAPSPESGDAETPEA